MRVALPRFWTLGFLLLLLATEASADGKYPVKKEAVNPDYENGQLWNQRFIEKGFDRYMGGCRTDRDEPGMKVMIDYASFEGGFDYGPDVDLHDVDVELAIAQHRAERRGRVGRLTEHVDIRVHDDRAVAKLGLELRGLHRHTRRLGRGVAHDPGQEWLAQPDRDREGRGQTGWRSTRDDRNLMRTRAATAVGRTQRWQEPWYSKGMRTVLVGAALLAGCADQAGMPQAPVARIDLRAAFGVTAIEPVGIAVAPNGDRFVFDQTLGLYQLVDGAAQPIVPMSAMPDPGTPITPPFTDITAIAPGQFALTAIGDGFVLDTTAMTLRQRFCYLPEGTPVDLEQQTAAIAYDADLDQLYAQPVTVDAQGVFQRSQLASYHRDTGASIQWYDVGGAVAATGMAVLPERGLVLGQGAHLDRFDLASGVMIPLDSLERYGVQSIDGLAVDRAAGTLLMVDRSTAELVEIELAQLAH